MATKSTAVKKGGAVDKTKSALDERGDGALAESGMMMDFASDAGSGMEGADRDSFAIPFLAVLQGLSPQVVDGTVAGASPGKLINTVTNELFDEAVVVPCAFKRSFLRWAPRDEGGGFKGEYSPAEVDGLISRGEAKKDDDGRLIIDGDLLKDTRQHFILLINESGGWTPAVMSMSSTQIKISKRWMAQIGGIQMQGPDGRMFNPPSFSHAYRIASNKQKNDAGTWFIYSVNMEGPLSDPSMYAAAKAFNKQVVSGKVNVQHQAEDVSETANDGDSF